MPEIKNTFTSGKMNKDLDERLVPNGQYRDGINIQVSTSEGSDVGTVQNILGNLNVFSYVPYYGPAGPDQFISTDNGNQIDPTAKCIGAIADEKNNCFYWFVYSSTKSVILKYKAVGLGGIEFVFVDTTNEVLEFSNNIITGINIIDDLLFWTDGQNEPKKIDVNLCMDGTHQGGHYNTRLIVPKRNISYNSDMPFTKENITVIKPNPKGKLEIDPKFETVVEATAEIELLGYGAGDTISITFDNFNPSSTSFVDGDIVRLLDVNSSSSIIDSQEIRVYIENSIVAPPANTYSCRILSLNPLTPNSLTNFNARREIESTIFPRKFIRFGYRWRYNSGEYSAFSSFSDPVFKPGAFDYSPQNAYNVAMENLLVSVKLWNFLPIETPKDVVQVDILYTESDSPTVYVVDSIKYYDAETVFLGVTQADRYSANHWNSNFYEVTADLIYAAVPENQLLRPYDSVPVTALAQEVTGSRIIYGNYEQNYNIDTKPVVKATYVSRYLNNKDYVYRYDGNMFANKGARQVQVVLGEGQKSLKSMRDYQLGVSYLDSYGRQTPIFTSNDSQFKIPKKHAGYKTKIEGKIITNPPVWADSFKVYVKETSTEYYNIAMSRVYQALDGDLWISFPSTERNKVDEDTFLILKKAVDTNQLVTEEARYKVLAIENEAPDYIKEVITPLVTLDVGRETGNVNNGEDVFSANPPTVDARYLDIDADSYNQLFGGPQPLNEILDPNSSTKMYLQFKNKFNQYSARYEIKNVHRALDPTGIYSSADPYVVTLVKLFNSSDGNFIYDQYPTTTFGGALDIKSGMKLVIYTSKKENLPEFEGVFFVKINADMVSQQKIVSGIADAVEYQKVEDAQVYHFSDTVALDSGTGTTSAQNTTINTYDATAEEIVASFDKTNAQAEWEEILKFKQDGLTGSSSDNPFFEGTTPGISPGFFIDQAVYVATHPAGSTSNDDFDTDNPLNNPNHVFNSVEHSSGDIFNNLYPNGGGIPNETGLKFGRGIYNENGNWYMELSFSGFQEHAADIDNDPIAGIQAQNDWDIDYNEINRSHLWRPGESTKLAYQNIYGGDNDKVTDIINKLNQSQFFKFEGQTTDDIFEIKGIEVKKRYNYVSPFHLMGWYTLMQAYNLSSSTSNQNWAYAAYINELEAANVSGITNQPRGIGYKTVYERFTRASNRRVTYILDLGTEDLSQVEIDVSGTQTNILEAANTGTPLTLAFLEVKIPDERGNIISENPAIFETEPKKTAELDLYYEASEALPLKITTQNSHMFIPTGSVVTCPGRPGVINTSNGYTTVFSTSSNLVKCVNPLDVVAYLGGPPPHTNVPIYFTRPDGSYTTAYIDSNLTIAAHLNGTIPLDSFYILPDVSRNQFALSWFNCYSFNNGIESNRIRDDFNAPMLSKGVKVSSTTDFTYERERRKSGLIFSGIYNSNTGINNLNQFIQAENITKDLNPTYGSIQKLFQRESDLIAFCEDRVVAILANKDTLFNADGSSNVVASTNVLGNANPFAGDYGISKNPESFAKDNYRAYFTDKQRGAVLRLSMDGLTPISEYGMSDFFKDTLKSSSEFIGSYDNRKDQYNITMPIVDTTISYKENVKGWPSFKSFVPEQALSLSGDYYTFKNGIPYKHHDETVDRNTFYGEYYSSSINILLNENPSVIKSFKTVKYEGSQSRVNQEVSRVETGYYNLQNIDGWYADLVLTDKGTSNEQRGSVSEFIEKEGKWFNNIKGDESRRKTDEFSFQGIGRAINIVVDPALYPAVMGCTNSAATNYNPLATVDNGSCVFTITPSPTYIGGCMDPNATNYDATATFDNGSCAYAPTTQIYGCTSQGATNYNPLATVDDGSCIPIIYGCTDQAAINYFSGANTDDGSCLYTMVPGCTDPQAQNFDPLATVDDGSCTYINQPIPGCTDPLALNYDPAATLDDGSCQYSPISGCTDPLAQNYDPAATVDDGSCTYAPSTPFSFRDINDND